MKKTLQIFLVIGILLSLTGLIRVSYFQSKAVLAQHLMMTAWQKNQQAIKILSNENDSTTGHLIPNKPWPWADTWPVLKISLPSIKVTRLVLKDASGESLAFGPGLMTPQISPGMLGNSFIAAHRDTHFSTIGQLKRGDKINIEQLDGEQITFNIDQIEIVDSRIEFPILNSPDSRITLVTCYPFDATEADTPFRYLVSASRNHQLAETALANLQR